MLLMTLITWGFASIPQDVFNTQFGEGLRAGFLNSASVRSLITAMCLLIIAIRVRTWFTGLAAVVAWVIFTLQIVPHLSENGVLPWLASLAIKATISPMSWCEYWLTYRVFQATKR